MTPPKSTRTIRILARIENPGCEAPELDWINSRTRLLGENFGVASRTIQFMIGNGEMVVVREEPVS